MAKVGADIAKAVNPFGGYEEHKDDWRVQRKQLLMRIHKETILNQEFFDPYLKDASTLFSYQQIMQRFQVASFEEKKEFFGETQEWITKLKRAIFYENQFDTVK